MIPIFIWLCHTQIPCHYAATLEFHKLGNAEQITCFIINHSKKHTESRFKPLLFCPYIDPNPCQKILIFWHFSYSTPWQLKWKQLQPHSIRHTLSTPRNLLISSHEKIRNSFCNHLWLTTHVLAMRAQILKIIFGQPSLRNALSNSHKVNTKSSSQDSLYSSILQSSPKSPKKYKIQIFAFFKLSTWDCDSAHTWGRKIFPIPQALYTTHTCHLCYNKIFKTTQFCCAACKIFWSKKLKKSYFDFWPTKNLQKMLS